MTTYENQKIMEIVKAPTDKNNIYATLNKEHLAKAMQELSHVELKTYLYLASNQNKYTFALSTKHIAETTGANKRNVQKSINSLIEKGYIQQSEGMRYTFIE